MKRLMTYVAVVVLLILISIGVLEYITPPPPQPPRFPAPPPVHGTSASLFWANQDITLADKNGELKIYPASTTKMLTCIIALEEGHDKLEQEAVITPFAMHQDGTLVGITPAKPITLHQLLYGMMLVSGNDAAVAAAETTGGSYSRFIQMMNEKAESIGARHSHFNNANGLTDPNHYSTANDMARIGAYAMRNPQFREIVGMKTYPMRFKDGSTRIIRNRNEFLESGFSGANGIKTGMTDAAGKCLVASAIRNGNLMVVSVYNDNARWQDVQSWLTYGFTCAEAWDRYQKELKAEPIVFKWVNQVMGREPNEEQTKKVQKTEVFGL